MRKKKFRIAWSRIANRDLEDIVSFIAVDSPSNAHRVLIRIRKTASSLETAPKRGRVVPELAHFGFRTWRELISSPYRIIYRISGNNVVVLAVLDGRRDIEDLLLERLVREKEEQG